MQADKVINVEEPEMFYQFLSGIRISHPVNEENARTLLERAACAFEWAALSYS